MRARDFLLPAVFLTSLPCCGAAADSLPCAAGLRVTGSFDFNVLRIVKSSAIPNIEADKPFLNSAWIQNAGGGLDVEKDIGRHVTVRTGIGGLVTSDIQGVDVNWKRIARQASAHLDDASVQLRSDTSHTPRLTATAGFFAYNYTQAMDFGGYLYTAGLHPMYLTSSAGAANIAGLRVSVNAPHPLRHDLIVNLETDREPYMDLSVGYVTTLSRRDALELGAGAKLCRLVAASAQERFTTYTYDTAIVVENNTDTSVVAYKIRMPYGGVKLMGRFFCDVPGVFGLSSTFTGQEGLRFWAEAAILGLKDYEASITGEGYPRVSERVVGMAGLTVPTHPLVANGLIPAALSLFLIAVEPDSVYFETARDPSGNVLFDTLWQSGGAFELDTLQNTVRLERGFDHKRARPFIWAGAALVSGLGTYLLERLSGVSMRLDRLCVEVEYCRSPFNNNHDGRSGLPAYVPAYDQLEGRKTQNDRWHYDDWRWAVIAKKSLGERLTVNAKAASDHMRLRDPSGWYLNVERLFAYWEWYWAVGINLSF